MTIREDMVRESQELFLPGTDAKHQTVQRHDSMTERLLLKKNKRFVYLIGELSQYSLT